MQNRPIKHGNSLALVIDKPTLNTLPVSADTPADTPLKIDTNGDQRLVAPYRDKSCLEKREASLGQVDQPFGDRLRGLAK